jgi:DNA polymerase-3 subunit gamma/tau
MAERADQSDPSDQRQGYVVLARRHRPVQFDQVIGQQHVTRTLHNAIRAGRVHHAYLLCGSRGVGKTTVARILAKALNCAEGPTATPCDRCDACRESGAAVDVFEIDGASHTGVDDIRDLRENVRYLPARARYKIYIIDEVHMLSTSAFNALLKTLEEPPPHVVFIFATTEPHKIPATILSRCQRFDFKRVAQATLVEHLTTLAREERVEIEGGGLSLIARAAEGSVRDALSLLDQVIAYAGTEAQPVTADRVAEVLGVADRRVLFALSAAVLERDVAAALQVIDELFTHGQDLSQFAQAFLAHLRDLVVARSCDNPAPLLDATEAELGELGRQALGDAGALLQQHFDRFSRAADEIARSSFPRLLLEMVLIEMAHAEPLLPLGDLLERLEQLEGRLGGAPLPPAGKGPAIGGRPGGGGGRATPARGRSGGNPGRSRERASGHGAGPGVALAPALAAHSDSEAVAADEPSRLRLVDSSPLERWQALLAQVEQAQPLAAATFVCGRLLAWNDDEVELGFVPGFELTRAEDRAKRELLQRECQRLFGRPLQLKVRALRPEEQASPDLNRMSAAQERSRQQAERAERLREEARTHPLTRVLVEQLGATIERIATEEDPR